MAFRNQVGGSLNMLDVLATLREGLQPRYEIEGAIGQGGMATVFRAADRQHGRRVAIKVLRPELTVELGEARFRREIEVAARLSHPNILSLYDSGAAGDLLYFVMPYVEGQSLRDRLRRETQLSVPEALGIAKQVASALAYAHSRGVVHRDIKPENILLTGDHALVADFGIARAFADDSITRLTSTGMAIGTPAYMSPEQISADRDVDGRSDIYSLACVLYEMLIGEPPFNGPTAQVILTRHSVERVPAMRPIRETIPESVELAVRTALAKMPADRYATATDFMEALETPVADSGPRAFSTILSRRSVRWTIPIATVAALALAAIIWIVPNVRSGDSSNAELDPTLVAIMPFRQIGTGGAEVAGLAEGIPELLYMRLPGDVGPHAVYPATVSAALAGRTEDEQPLPLEEALAVARHLSAGRVLLGQILAQGNRLVLSASLYTVPDGQEVARTRDISGPVDSLLPLVDQLTGELLLSGAGGDHQLASVATTDLQALREYLAGKAAFDGGDYGEAVQRYGAALDVDSSFALAALGLATAETFVRGGPDSPLADPRGRVLAWAARDRLSPRDRVYLKALAGPRYPKESSESQRLYAWEQAVQAQNDRVELWQGLGETLLHSGPWLGIHNLERRATEAFRRAVQLDSAFAPAVAHLLDLTAARGDTAEVRSLGAHYLAIDSTSDLADFYRWRIAMALADSAALRSIRARFVNLSPATLERIIAIAQLDGTGMADAETAGTILLAKSVSGRDARWAHVKLREVALNRGRPREAAEIISRLRGATPTRPFDALSDVVEALYWGADSARASAVVKERSAAADAPVPADAPPSSPQYFDICAVNLWRLAHGELGTIQDAIRKLRRVPNPLDEFATGFIDVCAAVLDTRLGAVQERPDAGRLLDQLDSLAQSGPPSTSWLIVAANLTVAELREQQGNIPAALAAARRRVSQYELGDPRVLVGLSTFLREEGRLAALSGDTVGAIQAYRHYLTLRDDPEPSVMPEVARVRSALAQLIDRGSEHRQ